MKYGVPVVATPLAVEGMFAQDGEECLIAWSAEEFAEKVIVCTDQLQIGPQLLCCKSPPTALGEAAPAVRSVHAAHEIAAWLHAQVVRAYTDCQLWSRLVRGGHANMLGHFSMESARPAVLEVRRGWVLRAVEHGARA